MASGCGNWQMDGETVVESGCTCYTFINCKYFLNGNKAMTNDLENKVFQIICERNLCSYMNHTKWNKFISAVKSEIPFPPAVSIKYVTQKAVVQNKIETENVDYLGDWKGENFPPQNFYFNIEWIKIRPRYLKYQGKMIGPELIDGAKEFEDILHIFNIPFEEKDGLYCIYGYK